MLGVDKKATDSATSSTSSTILSMVYFEYLCMCMCVCVCVTHYDAIIKMAVASDGHTMHSTIATSPRRFHIADEILGTVANGTATHTERVISHSLIRLTAAVLSPQTDCHTRNRVSHVNDIARSIRTNTG